jgi:hypothetical protein
MLKDHMSLDFLKSKIYQIRTAIISNEEKMAFGFPTCIVSALNVDESGSIWFLLDSNGRNVTEENIGFPVNLRFFRKGYYFTLNIDGLASIITHTKSVNRIMRVPETEADVNLGSALMIKVKILHADCYEWEIGPYKSWLKQGLQKSLSWLHLIKPAPFNRLPEYSIS